MWQGGFRDSGVGCAKGQADSLTAACLLVHPAPQTCLLGMIISVSVTTEGQSHSGAAALAKLGNSDLEL